MCGPVIDFFLFQFKRMEEASKKVAPGKTDHIHALKSCQIVLFKNSYCVAEFQYCSLLICQAFRDRTMDKKRWFFATQCFLTMYLQRIHEILYNVRYYMLHTKNDFKKASV